MAMNIHTDKQFEKRLSWLSRTLRKTKTQVVKDLVSEQYVLKLQGFRRGAFKSRLNLSAKKIARELKSLDKDHDLD